MLVLISFSIERVQVKYFSQFIFCRKFSFLDSLEVESDKLDCFQISLSSGFLFNPLLKSHIWRRINLSVKEKKSWLIFLTSILYNLLLANINCKDTESNTAASLVFDIELIFDEDMKTFISILASPFIMFVSPSARHCWLKNDLNFFA